MVPSAQIDGIGIHLLESGTECVAIVARGHGHIFSILGLGNVLVLKYLTVDKYGIGHQQRQAFHSLTSCSHVPEIVALCFGSHGVTRHTDMLGGVIAETASSEVDKVIDILEEIILEVGILGINVRQTAHGPESALCAVIIVLYLVET